jgi:hypothetical protein
MILEIGVYNLSFSYYLKAHQDRIPVLRAYLIPETKIKRFILEFWKDVYKKDPYNFIYR